MKEAVQKGYLPEALYKEYMLARTPYRKLSDKNTKETRKTVSDRYLRLRNLVMAHMTNMQSSKVMVSEVNAHTSAVGDKLEIHMKLQDEK